MDRVISGEIGALSDRSREIFRQIVESYLETGLAVGSRTIAQRLNGSLSPASIRNVMQDLEQSGLLYAPHTSAGRMPTELGLRMFVDGLLELGDLTDEERGAIEALCDRQGRSLEAALTEASHTLSGLTGWAGLVLAPKYDAPLKHVEFVHLNDERGLVIIVTESGAVENRVIELPRGLPPSALIEATNYLNARLRGRSLGEARRQIERELNAERAELDELSRKLVEAGLAIWSGGNDPALIVRGRANLLEEFGEAEDLARVRTLFDAMESKRDLIRLLELAHDGEGVRVFIGSENNLFSLSGSSVIVAPYSNSSQQVVGAIGVIGPRHLNYARIVPMVDLTAQVIGRLVG